MSEPPPAGVRVRILEYGPRALLTEYGSLDDVMAAAAHVRSLHLPGVIDVVPAARTVLVHHAAGADREAMVDALTRFPAFERAAAPLVEIAVRYDGEDLGAVATACDLTVDEVVAVHSAAEYTAAFCGFVPGFAYLVGLDPRLHLPRRATPRPRVPSGAVAIASEYAAVYPQATPGGWHLLGTTDVALWDESQQSPALVEPGARVRFVPT